MEKIQKRKTEHVSYGLIRARRKTMALKVSEDGTVTVRRIRTGNGKPGSGWQRSCF